MAVSLSADTKDALARDLPEAKHCRQALLAGLALYGKGRDGASFLTQRNAVARLFRLILRSSQDDDSASPHIMKIAGTRLTRAPSYRIALPPGLQTTPAKPLYRCDRIMEARAAFLACGSVSAGMQGYHLEFVL